MPRQSVPPDLIEEVFRFNIALEEADAGALRDVRNDFERMLAQTGSELESAGHRYDSDSAPEALKQVGAVLGKRRFLARLLAQAESRG